jgi:magnesium transporter
MITIYRFAPAKDGASDTQRLVPDRLQPDAAIPVDAAWIDLLEPTRDEESKAETFAGIDLPTIEEMDEIEPSELLYMDGDARFMTIRVLCLAKTNRPKIANVSFVRKGPALITVRYDDPKPFALFAQRAQRAGLPAGNPDAILIGLVDAIVGRAAEILRASGDRIDELSERVFEQSVETQRESKGYQQVLTILGREGARISKVRESLVSVEPMLRFAAPVKPGKQDEEDEEPPGHIGTMLRDITSLEAHTEYLLGKIQFLLDAMLGLVNLRQNDIIKLLSVITVVLTPPTFLASMYGMNFKTMPEYDWSYGYQYALVLMLASAVLPYLFFRWKRWL